MTLPAARPDAYRAAHDACARVDLSQRQQLRVTGPDRVSFLQGMVTNDVDALAVGATCPVAMLTAKGAMVGDGRVLKRDDELILDTGAGCGQAVADFLNKYLISEEAEVALAPELALVGLVGPEAAQWAQSIPGEAKVGLLPGLLGAGVDVLVRRELLPRVQTALASLAVVDEATWEVLRVEAGVPRFGADMTETTIPLEANLEKAIHYQKGCYIGQEVIARATYRGQMNKKLVGLLLGEAEAQAGTELKLGDKRVGRLTTVVHSAKKGQNVALGYVHRDHLTPGTELLLPSGARAVVQALPF